MTFSRMADGVIVTISDDEKTKPAKQFIEELLEALAPAAQFGGPNNAQPVDGKLLLERAMTSTATLGEIFKPDITAKSSKELIAPKPQSEAPLMSQGLVDFYRNGGGRR